MAQLPQEDGTPFSLPHDVPEVMPIDHPALNGKADAQEAYDEGRDDTVDVDPYRQDDDPIKSAKRLMKAGISSQEYYTINHGLIRRWAEYRYGHPAHIVGVKDGLERGGLYIAFEDDEPDIDIEPISWRAFFKILERNNLAFLYRTRTRSGAQSKFYQLVDRTDVGRVTEAKRVA